MHRITADSDDALFDIAATRRIEQVAAAALPPHALMQRAGLAAARLAMALAPDARTIWIACGPGNNGGDGFEAAAQLQRRGFRPIVTWAGDAQRLPPDAAMSLEHARAQGVVFAASPPATHDLAIDALLGIGATRAPQGPMAEWLQRMHAGAAPVLSIDVPSGLDADTGRAALALQATSVRRFCLTLLTLKPGLFTAQGRDAAGEVWFDDLDCGRTHEKPTARLNARPPDCLRAHASHKGSYGDVAVIGGAPGMGGAALLAASAALHAGAGRVYVAPLDESAAMFDAHRPELMFRHTGSLDLSSLTAVCGCGGGTAVRAVLARVLSTAQALVLDADALNALALDASLQTLLRRRAARGQPTVLTPHPLEAARLLASDTAHVQADRLRAAQSLADDFDCAVVLKGSGSVIAAPRETPRINPTGNARLATAGTGDVLAGMVGAGLAAGLPAMAAAREAVWRHGALADQWPASVPLTAGALARAGA
jgi:hydroxyethylthiazole kinase-like uncharacterized protein yjeF